jgi:pheromone shutdown protein TraB
MTEPREHTEDVFYVADDGPASESDAGDPRIHEEYVTRVDGDDAGDVLLVGVVHDHPASRHRVREVVASYGPDVLALELAPLSLPLFERAAAEPRDAPAVGDEMSDAIAAAPDARLVGIDGLDAGFFATLARRLAAERPDRGALRSLAGGVASVAKQAVACRVAALVGEHTRYRLWVDDPVEHDCTPADPPADQAAHERQQVATSRAFLSAVGQPTPVEIRDEVRETCMVRRLDALRDDGDVAAVVGLDHVDALAAGLSERSRGNSP